MTDAETTHAKMAYAEITGWGKCVPPAVLTNDDLAGFIDTSDEWIYSRTGMKKRHVSHVTTCEMAHVAACRALAAADLDPAELDLIVLGTTTPDDFVPNAASKLKNMLGADKAGCFDLNAACTSFLYSLNVASDMIRAGTARKALVLGAERLTTLMDWNKRDSAVLFGDGAGAVVLEASEEECGLLFGKTSCVPDTREAIMIEDWGYAKDFFANDRVHLTLSFLGQEVFKNAVKGMGNSCVELLQEAGIDQSEVGLMIPHQANTRIIDSIAKRLDFDSDKVVVKVDEYANTSAASIPLALCDALEEERVQPGMYVLMAAFGAGLTCGSALIKWGQRVTPLKQSDAELPPCNKTAREILEPSIQYHLGRSASNTQ